MKNQKKLAVVCAALVLSLSVGCGKPGTDGKDFIYKGLEITEHLGPSTGTVSFMVGGGTTELRLWDKLIAAFEAENEGIKVEKVTINDFDILYTQLLSGSAPDVIQIESTAFGNWAKSGALQSLQPLIEREQYDTSDYWEQVISMFSFDTEKGIRNSGDLFALPKDMGVYGIFVNRKLVEAAKTDGRLSAADYALVTDQENPMTFDQYLDIAKKLTVYDAVNTVNTVYGTNRVYWESYLWSLGDDILTSDYQLNEASENFRKVLEYSKNMVTTGGEDFCAPYTSASSSTSQDEMSMFTTGRIAMYWSGRWMVPSYDAAAMDYYCIPLPVAEKSDGSKGSSVGWCSTVGYGVSRNSEKGEMAWKLIKFLTSAEGYRIMNELNYNVPGRKPLITETAFADPTTNNSRLDAKSAGIFFKTAENARSNNGARLSSSNWITAFEDKLGLYFTGEIDTFDQLMKSVKNQVNASIKKSDPQLFE